MLFLPMSKAVCLKSALLFATIRSYSFSYPYKVLLQPAFFENGSPVHLSVEHTVLQK